MSFSSQRFPQLRQIGIYVLTICSSVALTLAILQLFPNQFIPERQSVNSEISLSTPATTVSQIKELQPGHSFVVAAVTQVSAAVVRIDTDRTVASSAPDPFFDDPFF